MAKGTKKSTGLSKKATSPKTEKETKKEPIQEVTTSFILTPTTISVKTTQTKEIVIDKYADEGKTLKLWRGTEITETFGIPEHTTLEDLHEQTAQIHESHKQRIRDFFESKKPENNTNEEVDRKAKELSKIGRRAPTVTTVESSHDNDDEEEEDEIEEEGIDDDEEDVEEDDDDDETEEDEDEDEV
jgi:hypothetical protein